MKIALHSNTAQTIYNFRLPLMAKLKEQGYEVVVIASRDKFLGLLEQKGFRVIEIRLNKDTLNPLSAIPFIRECKRIYLKEKIDLVHLFTPKPVIFGTIAAWLAGIRSLSSITGLGRIYLLPEPHPARIITNLLYRISGRLGKGFIFLNQDDRSLFLKDSIVPETKAHLILSEGVDVHHFQRPPQEDSVTQSLTFLYVGRLLKMKGIEIFLQAAEKLSQKYPKVKLVVVGDNMPEHTSLISNQDIEKYKKKCPQIEWKGLALDVRPFYASSSVLVFPSYYREGVPVCVLEAMSFGLPIITTDNVGCRETVKNGENGFLVRPLDVDDLVEKMECFVQNPGLVRSMGARSRELAVSKFASEKVVDQILKIYHTILW